MRLPAPLLRRNKKAHKNDFGHVLIIAGSPRMLGAAALAGLAALRSGTGLVTIGVPKSLNLILQKKINPSIMTLPLEETSEGTVALKAFQKLRTFFSKFNAVAIGPGLTIHPSTVALVLKLVREAPLPMVVDADALNALASDPEVLFAAAAPRILTPHPGEMARLIGKSKEAIEADRKAAVRNLVRKYPCVLLLKGHRTLVAARGFPVYVNTTGNAGMAKAGSGDVLTGIIAAFLGQGIDPFKAAQIGAWVHGRAGDKAAKIKGKASLIPTDIIDALGSVIR